MLTKWNAFKHGIDSATVKPGHTGLLATCLTDIRELEDEIAFTNTKISTISNQCQLFSQELISEFNLRGSQINDALNCAPVQASFKQYSDKFCSPLRNSITEMLILKTIMLPLEIALCFLGIRFVIRNKIDVPRATHQDDSDSEEMSPNS